MPHPITSLVLENRDSIVLDKVIGEEEEDEGYILYLVML